MIKNLGVFQDYTDNTLKTVFDIGENKIIEMSLLANKEEMDVVCAPTHHFCNLGCKMCHLTNNKLNKKMTPIHIDSFIESLYQALTKPNGEKRTNKKKLLISFMGVGEPTLNIKLIQDVFAKEKEIKNKLGYETIGYALATMMPNNNFEKLKETVLKLNMPLKIHFSMHNPIDKKRFELIPNTGVSVENALKFLEEYRRDFQKNKTLLEEYKKLHRTEDPTEIHYTLIEGTNDGNEELQEICELLKKYSIPIKFIRFNPIHELKNSEKEKMWITTIVKKIPGLRIKTYCPPGKEVGSSCGEFTKHYYHEEIETQKEKEEFEIWKSNHQIFEQAI